MTPDLRSGNQVSADTSFGGATSPIKRLLTGSNSKVFLFEFICGGGCLEFPQFGEPAGSLLAEGSAMLESVAIDLLSCIGTTITLPLDSRLAETKQFQWTDDPRITVSVVDTNESIPSAFDHARHHCEAAIIIAPEIENSLYYYTARAEEAKLQLLSPNSAVVAIGSDKWGTFQHLIQHDIATPITVLASEFRSQQHSKSIVLKPRFGAGSFGVEQKTAEQLTQTERSSDQLVQDFVSGVQASIAILCGADGNGDFVFPVTKQVFAPNSFHYIRSEIIKDSELQVRGERLLRQVVRSLPAFCGYLGIDIVFGKIPADDCLIEINPRFTSSYCWTRLPAKSN